MRQLKQHLGAQKSFKLAVMVGLLPLIAVSPVLDSYMLHTQQVSAATANDAAGPNRDWLGHLGRYALENTSNVSGAGTLYIPLYIENTGSRDDVPTHPPTNVRIEANDFAKGYIDSTYSRARFTWCEGSSRQNQTGYTRSTTRFTIPKECFTYQPTYNAWSTDVKADLQNNSGLVQFRLKFVSPNDGHQLFGYSTRNGERGFAVANRYRCDFGGSSTGCGKFYNYRIPFGTPCTVTKRTLVSASIFDGDNSTSASQYSIQYTKKFSVSVYDVTGTSKKVNFTSTSGSEGNNDNKTYRFYVEPGRRYQFRVNDVYTNNVLQFRLPYNSIEYNNDCSWDLNPTVSVDPATSEGGSNGLNVEYFMPNSGASTSGNVQWQLTRCLVNPGASSATYEEVADNTSNGVNTYNALGASCQQVTSKTGQKIAVGTVNRLGGLANQSIPDLPPGSRICYILSVNPPTDDAPSNQWRHSVPACVLIGKKPKVQIQGGDLLVGRNFAGIADVPTSNVQTAATIKTISGESVKFGSWVEYAAAATGTISQLASGAAYAGGTTNLLACQVALLTLANTQTTSPCGTGTQLGGYRTNRSIPDVAGAFVTSNATPAVSGSISLSGRNGVYRATGDVTITGGSIEQGQSVVINAPGRTVTIDGNITYNNGTMDGLADIPQVVIIAQNIRIRGVSTGTAVSRVDAWLIASGTLNTCYDASTANTLTISRCATPLTVNGPVMAGTLELWRTGGSGAGAAAGDPAEVFNLRPDAYLWAIKQVANSGRLESTYERELPPRF